MDQIAGSTSFTLFGIRVDCTAPVHTTATIWESAISRGGMQVVLADMWTLLMAQRDIAMWEALSAAEFVLPLGDDAIIRRVAARQHLPVTRADGLLFDLFDAAASTRKHVVIVAPSDELNTDLMLLRRAWPDLQVTGLPPGEIDDPAGDKELVKAVNDLGPELLVLGSASPWQERWSHAYRDDLEIGAALLLPTLHPAVAAIAQRAGQPVTSIGLLRRKAAIRRALSTTLGPVASASAETVGAWLHEAREGLADWSATLQAHRRPNTLKQVALPTPGQHAVSARARAGRAANESSGRWVGISPLARLGPPRQGGGLLSAALGGARASADPDPTAEVSDDRQYWAGQPTTALTVDQLSAASRITHKLDAVAEVGNDNLPPTTKLDPRVAQELARGIPHGAQGGADLAPTQRLHTSEPDAPSVSSVESEPTVLLPQASDVGAEPIPVAVEAFESEPTGDTPDEIGENDEEDEEYEVIEFGPLTAEMPSRTEDEPVSGAYRADDAPTPHQHDVHVESSFDEARGSAHVEPVKMRIITKYVVRRSRRRSMRERRYHRGLKSRHQGAQG